MLRRPSQENLESQEDNQYEPGAPHSAEDVAELWGAPPVYGLGNVGIGEDEGDEDEGMKEMKTQMMSIQVEQFHNHTMQA